MTTLELLDPMSMISYLWETIGVEVPMDAVRQYWRHNRQFGAPWAQHHPAAEDYIPLAIYGDSCSTKSVNFGPRYKILGIFLSCPLWRPKSVRASRWLLFCIDEKHLYRHHTLDTVLAYVCWAMNNLFTGKFPHCDMHGSALTGSKADRAGKWIAGRDLKFAMTELRGDWLWYQMLFRLRSSWLAGVTQPVCFLCPAMSSGPNRYWELSESSPLWNQQYSLAEFLTKQIPLHKASPLLAIRGFHHTMMRFCSMHVLNLGLLYGANGSSLNLVL